ncbi:MAG: cobalt-precorrin-4 C(11)-methyltransferase [Thermoprotei archaeon]|nr:MAG: cobalt-precorrin-4 C(11)-methyltransferase [Thermoprotei archaeon]
MNLHQRRAVYIVGCGPGDVELLTIKAYNILTSAQVLVYTGSLINPDILKLAKRAEVMLNSANMSWREILEVLVAGYNQGKLTAWAHDGDPTIYGGLWEVILALRENGIPYEIVPGVSSVAASAARLGVELTVPYYSQSVIITRPHGKTPLRSEERLSQLAKHHSTMVILLGAHAGEAIKNELLAGNFDLEDHVAVVYHATWGDEKKFICRLEELPLKLRERGVTRSATIVVGPAVEALLGAIKPTTSKVYGDHK